jgi:hypothetical protein
VHAPQLSPDRYRMPDPWEQIAKPVLGVHQESSGFKSRTKRFPNPVSYSNSTINPTTSIFSTTSPPGSPYNYNQSTNLQDYSFLDSEAPSPTPKIPSHPVSALRPPKIGLAYSLSQFSSPPSIPSNGIKNFDENLQIGFGMESSIISASRPQSTGNPFASTKSTVGRNNNTSGNRAKSADTIKKSRTPGHSFSRVPRDTRKSLFNNLEAALVSIFFLTSEPTMNLFLILIFFVLLK